MTTDALGAALSGLRVAQLGLDVTSTNIANASTPGYTRKVLPQNTIIAGNAAIGVQAGQVQRIVNASFQKDYRVQLGVDANLDTTQTYLARIVAAQGSTDSESNISAQIGNLYSQFVTLSGTPDSSTAQLALVQQAQKVAASFNSYAGQLLDMRNEIEGTINDEVTNLNDSLKQIADLNVKIASLGATGQSTANLEDQRDSLVKNVAGQLDVSYYTDGNGMMVLQTKNGEILADSSARTISFQNKQLTPSTVYPADGNGLFIQDSSTGGFDLASISPGGKIGALLQLRDQTIPSYTAQLDELSHTMMVRFNDQNLRLFTDASGTVPPNDPAAYTGLAGSMQVNSLIVNDPSLLQKGTSGPAPNPGSSAVIDNVIDYTFGKTKDASGTPNAAFSQTQLGYNRNINVNTVNSPNATLEEFATAMLQGQANDADQATNNYNTENQYMNEVAKRLSDDSGVNSDQEMTNMISLQKNYAASAKMVNALNELFQQLLNAF